IANELAKQGKRVVILEAGDGIPTDINDYMKRFYKASEKVPESPYTPALSDADGHFFKDGKFNAELNDPSKVPAGRPTVLMLGDWLDEKKSYLVQSKVNEQSSPFGSTYDRVAGGTSHWLGTCLRFVPNDFKMKTLYGATVPEFVDWPIGYDDLNGW